MLLRLGFDSVIDSNLKVPPKFLCPKVQITLACAKFPEILKKKLENARTSQKVPVKLSTVLQGFRYYCFDFPKLIQ
jgi:hypothetical protein